MSDENLWARRAVASLIQRSLLALSREFAQAALVEAMKRKP